MLLLLYGIEMVCSMQFSILHIVSGHHLPVSIVLINTKAVVRALIDQMQQHLYPSTYSGFNTDWWNLAKGQCYNRQNDSPFLIMV
jgi:hypothetical protein